MDLLQPILNVLKPMLDSLGIPIHWIGTSMATIFLITKYVKGWWDMTGWQVWLVSGGASLLISLTAFAGNWVTIIVSAALLTVLTSGLYGVASTAGKKTPNPFGGNPTKREG